MRVVTIKPMPPPLWDPVRVRTIKASTPPLWGRQAGSNNQGESAVAVGDTAGNTSQGTYAVAVGNQAGETAQSNYATAVGFQAGETSQKSYAVAVGYQAGQTSQGIESVAVGAKAGSNNQGIYATAVGVLAGETSQANFTTAVGQQAGRYNQGNSATAVGRFAGLTSQGIESVAMGYAAGSNNQGIYATAVGVAAGETSQANFTTAVGQQAGRYNQGESATAVGRFAGRTSQGNNAVAVGLSAGETSQGNNAVAVGNVAGYTSQGSNTVAVGSGAGKTSQGVSAVAVGVLAGNTSQGINTVAVGDSAGALNQSSGATALGRYAGNDDQGYNAVAVGHLAGQTSQGDGATAVGRQAGYTSQGNFAVAVGYLTGATSQGTYATAVGPNAGLTSQGINAVAVGRQAGQTSQGVDTVAVGVNAGLSYQTPGATALGAFAGRSYQGGLATALGYSAGATSQGSSAVAVGRLAGETSQGSNAVAMGNSAGQTNQGNNAVAVGYQAGRTNQHANSIVLNASGSALDTEGTGRTYIKPLRVATVASNVMTYDQTTGEVMDSGGLISNKFAVVSEQPPSALTGDTTTIQGHGKYVATSSSATGNGAAYKAFDKSVDGWQTSNDRYNSSGDLVSSASLGGVSGEWLKIELPYKAVLRHYSLKQSEDQTLDAQLKQFPKDFRILASNDNTTWTTIHSETAVERPTSVSDPAKIFVVDAPVAYKYYAIVVEKINAGANNGRAQIGELRLFTESFSVDGGIVTTTAASGLETGFTEHPVEPMTDFKTYVEGHGTYEASASNFTSGHEPWEAYTNIQGDPRWITNTNGYNSDGTYTGSVVSTDIGGTRYSGEWNQLKFPYAQTISHIDLYATGGVGIERAPTVGVILGSNDGEHWYKLTEFSGKTYIVNIATRIDVNATLSYMYVRLVCTNVGTSPSEGRCELNQIHYFSATGVTKMDNVLISGELAVDGGALQTSHIKWPKVPLKAAKSEGYVASASSTYKTLDQWQAWHAFENKSQYGGNYPAWISGENTFINSTGLPDTANCATFDNLSCEWIQIKQPTAIQLSSFKFKSRYLSSTPVSGAMYGSNDDFASYDKLTSFSDNTELEPIINVQSTEKYNAFRLVVTATTTAPTTDIDELQLFESTLGVGTSATTAKLTVDGGLGLAKGSQVFAGSDVITEFPKHDRPLVKYPEVAMTVATTGGYTASASSRYNSSGSYNVEHVFDNEILSDLNWISGGNPDTYNETTGIATSQDSLNGENGSYVTLELPKAIKPVYVRLYHRPADHQSPRAPKSGYIYGSNDNSTWTQIGSFSYSSHTGGDSEYKHISLDSGDYKYKYLTFQVTSIFPSAGASDAVSIRELEYWGYEEGDESVDVVHRSIPNKPGQQQLAVYYEARDSNSYSFADSSNVYDLSGNGVTGTITGNNGFDAEYNAWVFDGSGDYISTTSSGLGTGGAFDHSFAFWFKINRNITNNDYVVTFGEETNDNMIAVNISGRTLIHFDNWGTGVITGSVVTLGQWYHVACTHTGSATGDINNQLIYVNGVRQSTSATGTGTLAFTSNRITIGARPGTNNSNTPAAFLDGAVADVRFYKGKALNADQVRELYEYDAERFGHRQNLVALHKGNLGVGVPNPTSRFEVAGADGLQEYPPKAMTGYETYMEGHGVFRTFSPEGVIFSTINKPWYAFDKNVNNLWANDGKEYDTDGTYIGGENTGIINFNGNGTFPDGPWVGIEMPYKTKIESFVITSRANSQHVYEFPRKFSFYGTNGSDTWTLLKIFDNVSSPGSGLPSSPFYVYSDTYYSKYVFIWEETQGGDTIEQEVTLSNISLFGTPAPSSLEDGHLTLGKALTLPRVSGHPTGAETPRAESLVVHYDTTVDSVVSGDTVVDISGTGNNGTLNGAVYDTTERALTFDGVDDYVSGTLNNPAGAWVHSVSCWYKPLSTTTGVVWAIGTNSNSKQIAINNDGGVIKYFIYGCSGTPSPTSTFTTNKWHHIVAVFRNSETTATGGVLTGRDLYIDGVKQTMTAINTQFALNLNANTTFRLANQYNSLYNHSSISNFKLWNVALTAEEVAMEYALGRTGKSINLTDTALCLGGTVPRAQLDVRGSALFNRLNLVSNGTDTSLNAPLRIYDYDGLKAWKIYSAKVNGNLYFNGSDYTSGTACVMTDDGTSTTLNFTGQHRTFIKDIPFTRAEELEGLIVSADNNKYIKMSGGIEAGSNAITTNESLPVVSLSTVVNDKKCFGVISASEDPETRQEQYGNFVSVNKKEVGDTRVYINSVGEGAMWVTDINGPLESGDYITTSNVAGYGQKQDSEFLANYTVAKITMDCDFDPQDQPIQRIKQSNVVETHYMGVVSVTRGVPHEFVTTTVTADDEWSNVSISPSDVTYEEWSNLEANVQNTYTLTYTQTSNVVYDVKYTKTTTANVTQSDPWDNVYVDPPNVSYEEWSNLDASVQNTYTLTYTMTTKVEATEAIYSNLSTEDKEFFVPTYYQMVEQRVDAEYPGAVKHETITDRLVNVLDEHGQLQWEDDPSGATEKAYKIRYLDASGAQTDEANAVHIAAFVGVTYHCG
jgi:hypothetical protein